MNASAAFFGFDASPKLAVGAAEDHLARFLAGKPDVEPLALSGTVTPFSRTPGGEQGFSACLVLVYRVPDPQPLPAAWARAVPALAEPN